jgi:hypothetical protein
MTDRLTLAVAELVEALREAARVEAATSPREPDRLLSVDDARTLLGGISRDRIYREIGAGRLRTVTAGRRRLVPMSAIADFARPPGAPL